MLLSNTSNKRVMVSVMRAFLSFMPALLLMTLVTLPSTSAMFGKKKIVDKNSYCQTFFKPQGYGNTDHCLATKPDVRKNLDNAGGMIYPLQYNPEFCIPCEGAVTEDDFVVVEKKCISWGYGCDTFQNGDLLRIQYDDLLPDSGRPLGLQTFDEQIHRQTSECGACSICRPVSELQDALNKAKLNQETRRKFEYNFLLHYNDLRVAQCCVFNKQLQPAGIFD